MHQPWASLLVYGLKRVEGRSWPTAHRGKLWIHAASKEADPEVIEAMEFKGYNAVNQLVGYLMTNDSKYITTFNNSRKKILSYDRVEIMKAIINSYLGR